MVSGMRIYIIRAKRTTLYTFQFAHFSFFSYLCASIWFS